MASNVAEDIGSGEEPASQTVPLTAEPAVQFPPTEEAAPSEDATTPTTDNEEVSEPIVDDPLVENFQAGERPKLDLPLAGGLQVPSGFSSTAERDVVLQARTAMASRDFITANSILRDALLRGGDTQVEVERSWLLCRLAIKFWAAVRKGLGTVRKDQTLSLGGREYTVETLTTTGLFLRSADRELIEQPFAASLMTAELAESLANAYLIDSGPVADRIVAAFHAVDREGKPERLKLLCERMYERGLNVDLFLPELERSRQ